MGKVSAIEWTDSTWSPWYGCTKLSEGCRNCYMFRWAKRIGRNPNKVVRAKDGTFQAPIRWKEPRTIFVCSLGDFFHEDVRPIWREHAWNIMRSADQHTYLLLTKRPENIEAMLPEDWWYNPWPHVWLGVSAENQARADERIPKLLEIPATVHFVSAEPLLSEIDLSAYLVCGISWCIIGSESGKHRRPMRDDWVRRLVQQCKKASVAVFYKQQFKNRKKVSIPILDRKRYAEFPQITDKPNAR